LSSQRTKTQTKPKAANAAKAKAAASIVPNASCAKSSQPAICPIQPPQANTSATSATPAKPNTPDTLVAAVKPTTPELCNQLHATTLATPATLATPTTPALHKQLQAPTPATPATPSTHATPATVTSTTPAPLLATATISPSQSVAAPAPQALVPQPSAAFADPVEAALAGLSYDQIWGVRKSIDDRFPGIDVANRWEVCMRLYVRGQGSREVTVMLFSEDGRKLHSRHPKINTRLQASAVIEYTAKFVAKGYLYSFAGPMFRCLDDNGNEAAVSRVGVVHGAGGDFQAYWYVGGGTRVQSWYHACATQPGNINVQNALFDGCEHNRTMGERVTRC
jgi:hypothetical protein